ncbi:MAG TPA: 50S ribosomal protein L11 methyltransferase [Candidatus Limnocylindrales bacterium]|nr:50S ribosomal protein L11 methyltransferase [Candidatus Limnocylindrales bacterium]
MTDDRPTWRGAPSADALEGLSAGGTWLELSVEADAEAVEAVSEILSRVAPGGVSAEPAFELTDEGLGAEVDCSRPVTLRAYLPGIDAAAARRAAAQAEEALGHLQAFGLRPIGELRTRVVHEEDWADAWKRHFPVLRVGRRLVVRPTWRRHRKRPGDVVVALDPGMAFGTGLHPTTRLCLAGLERLADEGVVAGARVLDVGCGSGILGLAAARLGAAEVLGIDTDPIAVEATIANARCNRLGSRVRARQGSLPVAEGLFDVVLANLIASLLIDLALPLHEAVRPGQGSAGSGGRLLASGIFADREPEVRRAFAAAGLRVRHRAQEGDWVALETERLD